MEITKKDQKGFFFVVEFFRGQKTLLNSSVFFCVFRG